MPVDTPSTACISLTLDVEFISSLAQVFLKKFNQGSHDKVLLDVIVISALDLKEKLTAHPSLSVAEHEALPHVEELAGTTGNALSQVKARAINTTKLHTCLQTTMLLAWHELARGHAR